MQLIFSKSYDKKIKKLKKHSFEYDNLLKIIKLIERSDDFNMLKNLPIVRMYGFERLKYKYSDFYSFNLCKHGSTIRLIVRPDSNGILIYLVDISFDHYKDINCIGEICYE